jgi:methyl-accepting chemotaxis protein
MKWFYNLKIANKLVIGFLIVTFIAVAVGIIGLMNLYSISGADRLLYEENTIGLENTGNAAVYFQRIRFNTVKMIIENDAGKRDTCIKNISDYSAKADECLSKYEAAIEGAGQKKLFNTLAPLWNQYKSLIDDIVKLVQSGRKDQAQNLIFGDASTVGANLQNTFDKIFIYNSDTAKSRSDQNQRLASTATLTMIVVIIAGFLITMALVIFISGVINKPINKLVEASKKLAEGDVGVDVEATTTDEIGGLIRSFGGVVHTLKGLIAESTTLTRAAIEGKLDVRGKADDFKGAYREILQGVNSTLDTLVGHIDLMPAPLMIIDKDFTIRYMNKTGADLVGISQKQLIGSKCYDSLKIGDCKSGNCACAIAMQQNRMVTRETDAHPRGMNLEIAYTAIPLKDENQLLIGAMEMVVDQTAIKTAEKVSKKQADYQEKEVLKLLANIESLAQGKLQCNAEIEVTDQDTKAIGEIFTKIYRQYKDSIKTLASYVAEISGVLTEMSNSNMDLGITGDYRGDFIEIKNSLNMIIESFNNVLRDINSAADQVAAGSKQVSDSSMALSQGATEQASSVEELTASLAEISSQTRLNAQNANQANELADTAKSNAVQGDRQMNEMLKAMEEINVSSANISKIIKVIDEIAFQTNILALNAAVEAARAGQHGKGFAVVAEEVRNLAARSANAAKETTEMIEGSIRKVETGTKIANDTADALNRIVADVSKAASLVGNIAVASNEQASGIAQINQGLAQVSRVVQTNSATSQESAAASEELSGQAQLLKEQVDRFKLKRNFRSFKGGNELSPEILQMLEDMSAKKKADPCLNEEVQAESGASKTKIALSNQEFGKY